MDCTATITIYTKTKNKKNKNASTTKFSATICNPKTKDREIWTDE